MTVYVLTYSGWDFSQVVGVFSSVADAKAYQELRPPGRHDNANIDEYVIDDPDATATP